MDLPPAYDTPSLRTALARWIDYKIATDRVPTPMELDALLMQHKPQDFPAAVQNSIANGYKGCVAPGGPKRQDQPQAPKGFKLKTGAK
jgi:hypothetical protein